MIKKGVSLLMALALCLTLLPASALAAEAQGQTGQEQTVLTQGNDGQTQVPGQDGAGEDDKTSDEAPDKAPDKAPDEEPDEAVSAVQALIDALPAAEDISDANADEVIRPAGRHRRGEAGPDGGAGGPAGPDRIRCGGCRGAGAGRGA